MAHGCDKIAMPTRLQPQDAKTRILAVKRDPFHEARKHLCLAVTLLRHPPRCACANKSAAVKERQSTKGKILYRNCSGPLYLA
jgi:hypothetical protein